MTYCIKLFALSITLVFLCGIYPAMAEPKVKIGGSAELRGWSFDDILGKDYSWTESELYIWAQSDLTDNIHAKINLTYQHYLGRDNPLYIPKLTDLTLTSPFTTRDGVKLWEGYVTFHDLMNSNVSLTFGRTTQMYGTGFVISNNLPVDAVKASFGLGKTDVDLFVYKLVEDLSKISDKNLWGLYSQSKLREQLQIDAYLLYLQDRDATPREKLYTVGTRAVAGIPAVPKLSLNGELAYQNGDQGSVDLRAWGGYLGGLYEFAGTYKPSVYLNYVYLSGDNNPLDNKKDSWNNLAGHVDQDDFGEKGWGRIVDFNNGITNNMKVLWVGASAQPTEKVKSDLDIYDYRYNKKTDNNSKHLGYEVDLRVSYKYTENVAAEVIGAWFNPAKDYNNNQEVYLAKGAIKVNF